MNDNPQMSTPFDHIFFRGTGPPKPRCVETSTFPFGCNDPRRAHLSDTAESQLPSPS